MQYLGAISKMTEWSLFICKANYLISQSSKSMSLPVMPKKLKLNSYEDLQDLLELTPPKRCPFLHRGLEGKSKKSRDTWHNRQIWHWSTKWSRAKANRVLPTEPIGHSKHHLSTTQENPLHMDITKWSILKSDWLYSLQPKMEKLYTVTKNKTRSWLWLRSWTPYYQTQTQIEESRENH